MDTKEDSVKFEQNYGSQLDQRWGHKSSQGLENVPIHLKESVFHL